MATEPLEIQPQLDPRRQSQGDCVTSQTQNQHGGLLGIMHQLGAKVTAAAPGRERIWAQDCLADLRRLRDLFHGHVESVGAENGLFHELAVAAPRWTSRTNAT